MTTKVLLTTNHDHKPLNNQPIAVVIRNMADEEVENVKVAVRVRPFNNREVGRNAKLIIQMSGASTTITNPADANDFKKFSFDYSYWSFDGCKEEKDGYCSPDPGHPNGSKFCDQKKVFADVGQGILDNAWKGYNSTLFAYGQTGSGKSWSVIGYGANKGLVPMFCEELYKGIGEKREGASYEVKFSMLEIYNEVARDLLDAKMVGKKSASLKIRQHPKKGFYAEGLKEEVVGSYEEIAAKMEQGTVNRTVASTNMNATSSRAHTIVGITFIQKAKNNAGKEMEKKAVVNLVDLAGSERVESTGATGDRLKEGAGINMSLSCLGNVIKALADQSNGQKGVRVPYRDSVLTKLLMNALGGNSKTVMIAALSPADINYDETLSTLRYADRAKQIKTKATVNEDPTDKLIRELKEQNEKLKAQLSGGKIDMNEINKIADRENLSKEEIEQLKKEWMEEMKAQMTDNEKELQDMKLSYEEKLKAAQAAQAGNDEALQALQKDKKSHPHLYNLNFDPQLSGKIIHILRKTETEIGNRKGNDSDICMIGPGIHNQHAIIKIGDKKDGKVFIRPFEKDCRLLVNGTAISGETQLEHNDRIIVGSTHVWIFQNPLEKGIEKKHYPPITYEYSQEEIAAKAGINIQNVDSGDVAMLHEDLIEVMPAVEEANSISEELDKRVKFEIILVAPNMVGKLKGKAEGFEKHNMKSSRPEVCVKMKNLENGTEFVWPKEKFLNRLYLMKEMYNNYEEEDDWDLPEEKDPFQEDLNQEVEIGTAQVFLQPIAYMVEMKEQLEVVDLKGNKIGIMNVEVAPCDEKGKEYSEADDMFVDSPDDLVGTKVNFVFKLLNCRGLPNKYTDVHCKYRVYLNEKDTVTSKISLTANPDFNHSEIFKFHPATRQLVEYLNNGSIVVHIMGKQYIRKSAVASKKGLSTRDLIKSDRGVFSKTANLMNGFQMNGRVVDPQKQSAIVELLLLKKTQARLQQKCDFVKKLLDRAEERNRAKIPTSTLKGIFTATNDEQVAMMLKKFEAMDDDADDGFGSRPSSAKDSGVCTIL